MPDATEIGFALADGSRFALRLPSAAVRRITGAIQPELASPLPEPAGSLLLELALAPLLDAVEKVIGQSLCISGIGPVTTESGSAVLVLTATFGTEIVPMQVDLGPAAAAIEPDRLAPLLRLVEAARPCAAPVGKLPVLLAFVAGHVRLTCADLERLAPGDTVLPDVWHPARGEVAVTIAERLAARAAMDSGAVRLKGPLEPVAVDMAFGKARKGAEMAQNGQSADAELADEKPAEEKPVDAKPANEKPANEKRADAKPADGKAADGQSATGTSKGAAHDAAYLDALEVTLSFELARRTVELAELKAMGAGHVFDLGLDPKGAVELRAQGVRIGVGELVEIGDRLGVRVLRLFGQGKSA